MLIPVDGSRMESIIGILKFEDIDKSSRSENNSRWSPITGVYVGSSVFWLGLFQCVFRSQIMTAEWDPRNTKLFHVTDVLIIETQTVVF